MCDREVTKETLFTLQSEIREHISTITRALNIEMNRMFVSYYQQSDEINTNIVGFGRSDYTIPRSMCIKLCFTCELPLSFVKGSVEDGNILGICEIHLGSSYLMRLKHNSSVNQIPFFCRYISENEQREELYHFITNLPLFQKVQLINQWYSSFLGGNFMNCYYDIGVGLDLDQSKSIFQQYHFGIQRSPNYLNNQNSLTNNTRTLQTPDIVKNACTYLINFGLDNNILKF